MSATLSEILIAEHRHQTYSLIAMNKAIRQLQAELTPNELAKWVSLETRAQLLKLRSAAAQQKILALKDNPIEYIRGLHASIKRDSGEIRTLANALLKLVNDHPKTVKQWQQKHPPKPARKIVKRQQSANRSK